MNIVDPRAGEVIDEFLAYDPSLSPSGRFVAFERFRERSGASVQSTVMIYDVEQTNKTNRLMALGGFDQLKYVGIPIYPRNAVGLPGYVEIDDNPQSEGRLTMFWWLDETTVSSISHTNGQPFAQLQQLVRSGDTVYVTDASGRQRVGRVTTISVDSIEILAPVTPASGSAPHARRLLLWEHEVSLIARRNPDPVWNGGVNGASVGALSGVLLIYSSGGSDDFRGAMARVGVPLAVGGFAIGSLIDASIHSRSTVYRSPAPRVFRPSISPLLSKSGAGVLVSIQF